MKKKFLLLLITFLLLFSINTKAEESSQDTSNEKLIKAGLTPKSPIYGIDRFFERVSYLFTFSDEKRVKKLAKFSEERLAEINKIDSDKYEEWFDDLYDDYGSGINKANNILAKSIVKGKTSETKIHKMQGILEDVTTKEELIKNNAREKFNKEIKNRVQEIKIQVYLSAISDNITEEEQNKFKNYGYSVVVKLKALTKLTGLTMDELLELDIFEVDDPVTKKIEKDIDYGKLEELLELNKSDLINNLKEYHKNRVEERKAKKEQGSGSNNELEERREEAKRRQEEIVKGINERVNEKKRGKDD